ncbi:BCCT family transporter [Corynebacterium sp.]|uniref:BCCT family transporter n=1 Tax=Corynebacterium sp. TaxID=1720 RepID=UPI0025C4E2D1|nr:BCCT family transporter [Corynebacterium sp.]
MTGRGPDRLVLGVSAGFIVIFVAVCVAFGPRARDTFSVISGWLMTNLNWLYIAGVTVALLFLVALAFSHFGRMRLGPDGEKPEYSLTSWFAMLFAGGLGSVLMFWGVAEPINHAVNVPMQNEEPMSHEAVNQAMGFTMYHFGIHMWVIFALPGLALGYFIYKRNLPPRVSSIFAPILGGAIYAWPGKLIDALAIIGTVFGIAVSLGLGTLQIESGLGRVFGVEGSTLLLVGIIVAIVALASWSVAAGLDKGIKNLSNINIVMAVVLMLFVLATGPTLMLLRGTMDTASLYAEWLPRLMFWSDADEITVDGWQGTWTVFYWAWTICWSPFIGMFVARISKGRTVREFVGGVLALPALFILVWFAVFGFAGLNAERQDPGSISGPVVEQGDAAASLFILLDTLPWTTLVSGFALVVVAIFFVTSIDSAALVTDMFAVGEENVTPTYQRVLWAASIGAVAAAILVMSPQAGIEALQEISIIIGLPFFLMFFVMMYSILKGMNNDYHARPEPRTRQWEKTDSPEALEENERKPAPGYDETGDELPTAIYDEEGNLIVPGNIIVAGDVGVVGDIGTADPDDYGAFADIDLPDGDREG